MQSGDLFTYSPEGPDPANASSSDDSEDMSEDENGLKRTESSPQPLNKFTEIKEQMYQVRLNVFFSSHLLNFLIQVSIINFQWNLKLVI